MDRIWQWTWNRYQAKYSWAFWAVSSLLSLPVYLFWSSLSVAVEGSGDYVQVALFTVVGIPVLGYVNVQPGRGWGRQVDRWAARQEVDRATVLDATYAWTREVIVRMVASNGVWVGVLSVAVAAMARTTSSRLVQYGILGLLVGIAFGLNSVHNLVEAVARPARIAIAGDAGIGDSLPRSRPSFAAWSNVFVVAIVFIFAVDGAMLAAAFGHAPDEPVLFIVIGVAMALFYGVPFTVGLGFSPSLSPSARPRAEGPPAAHRHRRLRRRLPHLPRGGTTASACAPLSIAIPRRPLSRSTSRRAWRRSRCGTGRPSRCGRTGAASRGRSSACAAATA